MSRSQEALLTCSGKGQASMAVSAGVRWADSAGDVGNRLAFVGDAGGFLEGFFVAGDDLDVLAPARSGHLEEFSMHGVGGNHHGVHRFALGAVSGNGVAVG